MANAIGTRPAALTETPAPTPSQVGGESQLGKCRALLPRPNRTDALIIDGATR
jgi:hypothetical protein